MAVAMTSTTTSPLPKTEPRRVSVSTGNNTAKRLSVTLGPTVYVPVPANAASPAARSALTLPVDITRQQVRRPSAAQIVHVRSDGARRESVISETPSVDGADPVMIQTTTTQTAYRRGSHARGSWLIAQTPDSTWYPGAAGGLSFEAPAVLGEGVSAAPVQRVERRRASSLISTAGYGARRYSIPQTPESRYYSGSVNQVTFGGPAAEEGGAGAIADAAATAEPALGTQRQVVMTGTSPEKIAAQTASSTALGMAAATMDGAGPSYGMPPPVQMAPPMQMFPGAQMGMGMQCGGMQIPFGSYLRPTPEGGFVICMADTGAEIPVQGMSQQPMAAPPMPMHPYAQYGQYSQYMPQAPAVQYTREQVTTIMLRNIPQRFNREMLMDDMNQRGFHGAYDFLYLPIDFSTTNSVGYSFINFVSEAELARFKACYIGLKLSDDSPKVCEICDAKAQGKARNVEFYRNSTVMGMDEQYHPVLLENGMRLPFPKPTRALGPVQRRPARAGGQQKS